MLTFRSLITLLLAIAVGIGMAEVADGRQFPAPDSAEITVMSPDSLELVGQLYFPKTIGKAKLPLVILLHQSTETHATWKEFEEPLCNKGLVVFAMDMRGYGYSIFDFRTQRNRPPNTFYVGEFSKYPGDVEQMLQQVLLKHGNMIDSNNIAIVGAELGANTAMIFAANHPNVKFTGLISPALEYNGLRIAEPIKKYGDRPLFIATSDKDVYSLESCTLLSDLLPRPLDVKVYNSYHYGNMLLLTQPELSQELGSRIVRYLKPNEGR